MKLTDFLQDVGRPATYYPSLRKITGSTNATLFLCQLIYWKGKEADPNGWIYKTADDMQEETGLSYDEQKTARTKLKEAGLLDEHYARLEHQMRYRVNFDAINEQWGNTEQPIPQNGNTVFGKAEIQCSLNESESTTENTTEQPYKFYKTTKAELAASNLEWAIIAGIEVTQEQQDAYKLKTDAVNAFEAAWGITRPWSNWWNGRPEWRGLLAKIVEIYQSDPNAFVRYVTWHDGKTYGESKSAPQIQRDPDCFYTAWDMFKRQDGKSNNPKDDRSSMIRTL